MFDSYHWVRADLGDGALDAARAELYAPSDIAATRAAFRALLSSGSTAALGIALDHYRYAEASSRFGTGNPFIAESDDVLRRARAALDEPAVGKGEEGAAIEGANHASALAAMVNLAGPEDAERVARVLDAAQGADVRSGGVQLARRIAEVAEVDPALDAALARAVGNPDWLPRERADALQALYEATPAEGARQARRHLHDRDLVVQAHAAWVLLRDDLRANRAQVARLVASWPERTPYPAFEVRQILQAEDESD